MVQQLATSVLTLETPAPMLIADLTASLSDPVHAPISASMLYAMVACPHRVIMDLFADPADRDAVSPFMQLLWDRGAAYEHDVIAGVGEPFLDLSGYGGEEKERRTLEAMDRGGPLIYSGRISAGDLLGVPDLLREEAGGYIAGDIKSGAGEEGGGEDEDGKPKKSYAMQLALYTDILEQLGRSVGRRGFIWDIHGKDVACDLVAMQGMWKPRALRDDYLVCLQEVRAIVSRALKTRPAYSSGNCENCVWYTSCAGALETTHDLTLIPELGRSLRDTLIDRIGSIRELAEVNPEGFIEGKKTVFAGIGPDRLRQFDDRAELLATKGSKPYLRAPVQLPIADRELFFDIEVDPMRDVCYLHGFVERQGGNNDGERFVGFFADEATPAAEETAFAASWAYMQASQPCTIYYYSKYERTCYRKLQARYPHVCTTDEIEQMFDPARSVDLYFDVVLKATEWPTRDFSIKTLAKHLGFAWWDTHPSGAASIEWFDRWITTRDPDIRQGILDYNDDDCRATRVLLDGIRAMANEDEQGSSHSGGHIP
jgi:predicted RecB family nuclease